jgi:hypothetical protein
MARLRFDGEVEGIAAIFAPFVTSVTWLKYVEQATLKLDTKVLMKLSELIAKLKVCHDNLSFTAKFMEAVFRNLMENNEVLKTFDWKGDEQQQWIAVMARRVRAMLRHAQQGLLKKSKAAWCVAISEHIANVPVCPEEPEDDLEVDEGEEGEEEEKGEGDESESGKEEAEFWEEMAKAPEPEASAEATKPPEPEAAPEAEGKPQTKKDQHQTTHIQTTLNTTNININIKQQHNISTHIRIHITLVTHINTSMEQHFRIL